MIYNVNTHKENHAEVMRAIRDSLLAQSDWAMAADAPTDKAEWAKYRQALRDFPATWKPAETANFPEAPSDLA